MSEIPTEALHAAHVAAQEAYYDASPPAGDRATWLRMVDEIAPILFAAGVQAGREAAEAALYAYDRTDRNRLITLDMAARIARGDDQEARVCTCGNRDGFYGTAGELPRTRQSVPSRDPECPFHGRDQ